MDRESALDLLRQNHSFPGSYEFRVVVLPEAVRSAVEVVTRTGAVVDDVRERPSKSGRYISLRLRARVERAEAVLDVYEALGSASGVVTTL